MNYVIGNWKMNPNGLEEAEKLFNSVTESDNVIICPPFVYLSSLSKIDSKIKLGAQNCFGKEKGAFTGEVSCSMLKDFCDYVIIGHSERRRLFEDDEMIAEKMEAVSGSELTPILCVGETEEQHEQGRTEEVLRKQLKKDLESIEETSLIVGYEPRWAIGSGNPCSPEEAGKAASFIRNYLKEKGMDAPVVYGGSVNSDNAASYLEDFDGWLIGGASLDPDEFNKIIEISIKR